MGSLRFEPRHLIYPHRRNPVPITTSGSPVFTVTGSKSSIVVGRKELINNESSDSEFSGLDNGSTTSNKRISTLIQPADDNLHQYIIDHSKNTSYLKGKFLGKGGSARVHELTDLTTGNVYAGKIIPKSRITEPRHKEKITREIELQRNLVHLNVVRYHHSFEDSDNFYIILENCSKKSLVHVMKYRKTLTEPEVRFYLRQLIDGLRYVHESQIVHRDLKLGNMFLSENMTLKIGDFGLAARLDEFDVAICGTPNYIAPEVLSCQGHGFEADLWAVGCIMYAMLVGQPPFETSRLTETYSRITNNLYIFPKGVSHSARSLIRQLLAHDPADRPTLEQVLKHDFFTSGFVPTSLPSSCCYKSPNFGSDNDSGIKSDIDSSNENIDPLTYQESVKVSNSSHKDQHVTSQSLKETSVKNEAVCLDKNDSRPFSPAVQQSLYSALGSCLDHAAHTPSNPTPVAYNPLFISKWIDYSNKYGFGFQLSDQTVCVLFKDSTRISYSSDRNRLDFQDSVGKICSCSLNSVLPPHLMERLNLLRYFAKFMDENLTEGCDNQQNQSSYVHMKRWVRTPKAIIMQLDNNTLQINFFEDHTKIILSTDSTTQYWVTYIDSDRLSTTYRLEDISKYGCESTLRQRLVFALTVLREFSELDGDNV